MEFDVIIAGSGPAAIAAASVFLKTDIRIALICGGMDVGSSENQKLYKEADFESSYHESLTLNRVRGVGGTSELWGGRLVEFSHSDFFKTSWMGGKWPIEHIDLIPYYQKSLSFFGIKLDRNDVHQEQHLPESKLFSKDFSLHKEQNWGNHRNCLKISPPEIWTDIGNIFTEYFRKLSQNKNIKIFQDAHLISIELDSKTLKSVTISDKSGEITLSGDKLLLACGAIENTRQLLILKHRYKNLFDDSRSVIGKGYSTHFFLDFPEIAKPDTTFWDFKRIKGGLLKNRFSFEDFNHEPSFACYFAFPALQSNSMNSFIRYSLHSLKKYKINVLTSSNLRKRLIRLIRNLRNMNKDNIIVTKNNLNYQFLHVQVEFESNHNCYITLGKKRDQFGNFLPNARLHFNESHEKNYQKIVGFIQSIFPEVRIDNERALQKYVEMAKSPNSHAHQIGGTIMGNDKSNSVVNSYGEVHEIPNVYMLGSSTFVTAGEANPTHTIVALAIRTAEKIKQDFLEN